MARPIKIGLNYFPFDVDLFDDDKMQLISGEFGTSGEVVFVRLLCKIYKNGYYYPWGEDEALLFAKGVGIPRTLVTEIVHGCVRRSLFDKRVFDVFKILTSKGIQDRYGEVCKQLKRPVRIEPEHDCRNLHQLKTNLTELIENKGWQKKDELPSNKQGFSGSETIINGSDNAQRKGKETKGKENEIKLFDTNAGYLTRFFSESSDTDRLLLSQHIRLPPPATIQKPWVEAFNRHLYFEKKEHPTYEQWLSHFRHWLPQNLKELQLNKTPAEKQNRNYLN